MKKVLNCTFGQLPLGKVPNIDNTTTNNNNKNNNSNNNKHNRNDNNI